MASSISLSDDDFALDAPPGYLSQKHKERYIPLMATLLGATFVLQMILPMIIMLIAMPMMMFQGFSGGMPQYAKMSAWQDALWYPRVEGPGGSRGGCKLQAVDYAGKPIDKPSISLDMQPDWLIADGERLWAVSKNEVADIWADGSRPVSMHPARYLLHSSKPFLFEGKLAIVDHDLDQPPELFTFFDGEWNSVAKLSVPMSSSLVGGPPSPDDPADAERPDNLLPIDAQPAKPSLQAISQNLGAGMGVGEDAVQVVATPDAVYLIRSENGRLFSCRNLPIAPNHKADSPPVEWLELDASATTWAATTVDNAPAVVLRSSREKNSLELWRLAEERWQRVARVDSWAAGPSAALSAFTTPDGKRTFAVTEVMGGLSAELIELKPDGISRVADLESALGFANPLSSSYLWMQAGLQLPVFALTFLMVVAATWLMKTHRDPNYFKGRVPVAYASVLRRYFAVLIDAFINLGPVVIGWMWWWSHNEMSWAKFFRTMDAGPDVVKNFFLSLIPGLVATVGWFFVCKVMEWLLISFFGCTIGKFLCGVRVVRKNLDAPGLLWGLVRNLMSWMELPILNGIIAVTLVAFLQHRQRLADLVAGTIVVKSSSLREARAALQTLA
jgi:uncharacterized RDD family membrane protein YckC